MEMSPAWPFLKSAPLSPHSFQLVCSMVAQSPQGMPNPQWTDSISGHMSTRFVRLFITINWLTLRACEGGTLHGAGN